MDKDRLVAVRLPTTLGTVESYSVSLALLMVVSAASRVLQPLYNGHKPVKLFNISPLVFGIGPLQCKKHGAVILSQPCLPDVVPV